MKLELKHIAPYLPYRVKCAFIIRDEIVKVGVLNKVIINNCETHPVRYSIDTLNELEHEWMFKPILRPLSDLSKEIEHNGKKFIPVRELESIRKGLDIYKPLNLDYPIEVILETENYSQDIDLYDGHLVVQKLIEWHFDIFGLREKNLCIYYNEI